MSRFANTDNLIISSNLGLGELLGTEQIGGDEFYIVQSVDSSVKAYYPITEKEQFRKISSTDEIDKIIDQLLDNIAIKSYESKKDRITFFKEESQIQNIQNLSLLIRELYDLSDRGTIEDKILDNLIDSLALELSVIKDIEHVNAKDIVSKQLKRRNDE